MLLIQVLCVLLPQVGLPLLGDDPVGVGPINQVLIVVEYLLIEADIPLLLHKEAIVFLGVGSRHDQVDDCDHYDVQTGKE